MNCNFKTIWRFRSLVIIRVVCRLNSTSIDWISWEKMNFICSNYSSDRREGINLGRSGIVVGRERIQREVGLEGISGTALEGMDRIFVVFFV